MDNGKSKPQIEIFIVIKDYTGRKYYLLKVVRRRFDVYCIPPHLGVHYSLHKSGESHFRFEKKAGKTGKERAVVLISGEAGKPINNGIMRACLKDLGRASGICTALYPITSLREDFEEFNRSPGECFEIDKGPFPKDTKFIKIGVWAIPARNEVSFEFTNPNIPAELLYKVAQCEPQIWICARPLDSSV